MVREETLQTINAIPSLDSLLEQSKRALAPYAKEVKFAFLFGSYASGTADNWSDLDVGIYFSPDVSDEKRTEIRFALMDALEPLETQVGYLDDEDMSPEIFIAAAEGIPIAMNDVDAYNEALMKKIHALEEMKLIGLIG